MRLYEAAVAPARKFRRLDMVSNISPYDGSVKLPQRVRDIVESRAAEVPFPALKRAAEAASEQYRAGRATRNLGLGPRERVAAYLTTRMPATYAAAFTVLNEVRARLDAPPASLLDAGGGTGSAALAARELFPSLERIVVLETDAALASAGREILPEAAWRAEDFTHAADPHDLIVAAYALGESRDPEQAAMRLWQAAACALVIIEPGTPGGFTMIRGIRDRLLAAGAHLIAPCPGPFPCPMAGGDWCHFAARVERSGLHRRLKGAALGYEDEKYSYIAVAKTPARPAVARVVRHPQQRPGLITLQLCHEGRIATARVTHSRREQFRAARKTNWGDEWNG